MQAGSKGIWQGCQEKQAESRHIISLKNRTSNRQQQQQQQEEESNKRKNGTAEALVHNLNAASGIYKYGTIGRYNAIFEM